MDVHSVLQPILRFVLVATFMYPTYDKLTNSYLNHGNSTKNKYANHLCPRKDLIRASEWMFKAIVTIHTFLGIKYLLLSLLYLDWFADYRYYDCYVLGRFAFASRSYIVTIIIVVANIAFTLGYRTITILRTAPNFDYELFRFLLMDPDEVVWNEIQLQRNFIDHDRRMTSCEIGGRRTSEFNERYSFGALNSKYSRPGYGKLKYHFENLFEKIHQEGQTAATLLRLSRTSYVWHKLSRIILGHFVGGISMAIAACSVYTYSFVLERVLTTHGFIVNYPNCISYINSLGPDESEAYSYIYQSNSSMLASRSIPSVPMVNFYHIVRLILDSMENLFVWVDLLSSGTLQTALMIIQSLDLLAHEQELEKALVESIHHMRGRLSTPMRNSVHLDRIGVLSQSDGTVNRLEPLPTEPKDICASTTQAHILDYFRMVERYQGYVVFQTIATWILWIAVTLGISFWLAANKYSDLHAIFRWSQVGLAIMAVSCMSTSAILESKSRRLYHLITVAMAIDRDVLDTKIRWCRFTNFFYPLPKYCFASHQSAFSWLLCMKVSQWKFSRKT